MPERDCTWCGEHFTWGEGERPSGCPKCMERLPALPDPKTMTPEERLAELEGYEPILEVPFDMLHARIEALAQRPVWTSELGTSGMQALKREIASGQPATTAEALEKAIAPFAEQGKPTVVVEIEARDDEAR